MVEDLGKAKLYGLIVGLVIVAFFAVAVFGGDLIDTFRTDDEEPLNGEDPNGEPSPGDSIDMEFDSLYISLYTVQEQEMPTENDETETQEVEMEQRLWLQKSNDDGINLRTEVDQNEQTTTQIYNHGEERMYVEQMGQWFYEEATIEELGLQEFVEEYEGIAKDNDEGDQYVEERTDPQTGEMTETKWDIQVIDIDEGIEDDKFTPPEDAEPEPMPEQ